MKEELKELLEESITRNLDAGNAAEKGSKEQQEAYRNAAELADRLLKDEELDIKYNSELQKLTADKEKAEKELEMRKEDNRKSRIIQWAVIGVGIVGGIAKHLFFDYEAEKDRQFEYADNHSTTAGKSLMREIFRLK